MTIIELRDELEKLIHKGHGDKSVQVMNSPDDNLSGDWEDASDVFVAGDGNICLM